VLFYFVEGAFFFTGHVEIEGESCGALVESWSTGEFVILLRSLFGGGVELR
jgi:hypothetical protein